MLLSPVPGKAGPEASSPSEGLHFHAGSVSSHIVLALTEDRALQMCLQHDPVSVINLQVVPGPSAWELRGG